MRITLSDIVAYLNAVQIRASYGAVAAVLGGDPRQIGNDLGGPTQRNPEASWVVNATSGRPTGYRPEQLHPALTSNGLVIVSGTDLRRRVTEWKATGSHARALEENIGSVHRATAPEVPVSSLPVSNRAGVSQAIVQRRVASTGQGVGSPTRVARRDLQPLSVDDLNGIRRDLTALVSSLDHRGDGSTAREGIASRIKRLSGDAGPIPKEVATMMLVVTEMRNSAEYRSKRPTATESEVVRSAWQAVQEWHAGRSA